MCLFVFRQVADKVVRAIPTTPQGRLDVAQAQLDAAKMKLGELKDVLDRAPDIEVAQHVEKASRSAANPSSTQCRGQVKPLPVLQEQYDE